MKKLMLFCLLALGPALFVVLNNRAENDPIMKQAKSLLQEYEGYSTLSPQPIPEPPPEEDPASSWRSAYSKGSKGPLRVNVMPDGIYRPQSYENTAYAWPGKELTIWGNVHGGTPPYTYVWDFGDGTPPASGSVSDPPHFRYIAVIHSYSTMGPKYATLTVTDKNGNWDSDVVRIDVVPQTLEIEVNAAIENGLRWLYRNQYSGGYWRSYWPRHYYYLSPTALAVLAFENRGHFPTNDIDEDIYAETVQSGLAYIFNHAYTCSIDTQECFNPDTDGDEIGIYFDDGDHYFRGQMYNQGIAMMAVVGSGDPSLVASSTSSPDVDGHTYGEIIVDAVDYCAWAQNDPPFNARGGWRYKPNYGYYPYTSDNSVSQWPAIGLEAAESEWNICAPDSLKGELLLWIDFSQASNGCFGYTDPYGNTGRFAMTAAGLCELAYCDVDTSDQMVRDALSWLCNEWNSSGMWGNFASLYAMYGLAKGCRISVPGEIKSICGHDWQDEYDSWLVDNQESGGSWHGSGYGNDRVLDTAFGILILIRGIVCPGPVAVINAPSTIGPGTSFPMDANNSYHPDSSKQIVEWLWDFDKEDGIDWDNPDAVGHNVENPGYPLPFPLLEDTFWVTLKVCDEGSETPPCTTVKCDVKEHRVIVWRKNNRPIADPGPPGPGEVYAGRVGEPIILDGTDSWDPDTEWGDYIASYSWDLDGDDTFRDCTTPICTLFCKEVYSGMIGLVVCDSYDTCSIPAQGYVNCWCSKVDVFLTDQDIFFAPSTPLPHETVTLYAVVHCDTASDPIGSVKVRFYDGDPDIAVHQIGSDQMVYNLVAGAIDTVEVSWTFPDSVPHDVYVRLDPDQELEEYDEDNNEASRELVPTFILPATVELVPDELDLTPNLPPVKCYIELPQGYSVKYIEEVSMCGCREECIHPLAEPWEIGDYDEDGIPDLMVAFDYLASLRVVDLKRCGIATIEGMVQVGSIEATFVGQDTVKANNPGGCIIGEVTDGATGEPLDGVLVQVLRDTLVLGWDITKADGRYELSYVVPGVYEVSASKDGYGGAVEKGVESVEAETTVVNFQFSPISVPEEGETKVPKTFSLSQNYPNPFNPVTTIRYGLPKATYVRLTLYNISGQRIETLVDEHQEAGYHEVSWSAEGLANGIYFYRIEAGEFIQTKKMIVLK